jgi:hypothetical protein
MCVANGGFTSRDLPFVRRAGGFKALRRCQRGGGKTHSQQLRQEVFQFVFSRCAVLLNSDRQLEQAEMFGAEM